MKLKSIVWIALGLGALVTIKYTCFAPKTGPTQDQKSKTPAALVSAYVVTTQKLDNKIYASGSVLANEEVELHAEIAGRITALYLKEGSPVSKGQLLVKINDSDLQAQLKKLLLQQKLAADKESRQQQLLNINGISKEEYELAQNNLNGLLADIDYLKSQIAKTEIRAPFSGQVGLKWVSDGSYVTPTQKIASIQQLDPLKIDFSIPEKYAAVVKKGDEVLFTVAGDKTEHLAHIYAIEPKIDPTTRTLQTRALYTNRKSDVFPGAFASIKLVLQAIPNALMVPTQAVIPILKGKKVFVVKNGQAQSVKIETGIRTDTQLEVTDGLQEGDSVIVSGIMQLKDKMPVKFKKK